MSVESRGEGGGEDEERRRKGKEKGGDTINTNHPQVFHIQGGGEEEGERKGGPQLVDFSTLIDS